MGSPPVIVERPLPAFRRMVVDLTAPAASARALGGSNKPLAVEGHSLRDDQLWEPLTLVELGLHSDAEGSGSHFLERVGRTGLQAEVDCLTARDLSEVADAFGA